MALPEILPPITKPFLLTGHAQTRSSVYRDAQMGTGHARRRRQTTTGPRVVSVGWVLTEAEAQAVDGWFENSLAGGTRAFAARVAEVGGTDRSRSWFSATWVGQILWTPLHKGRWRAEGQLLLTGEPSQTGPVSTSAEVEFGLSLFATATAEQSAYAEVEFSAALRSVQLAEVEFSAALLSVEAAVRITTDGDTRITTDGDRRVLTPQ